MEYPEISIVIGSWGSYNSCNRRALGSEWLNFADFESWEEIEEALKKTGLSAQRYVHPKDLFETLKESGVLDDTRKYDTMLAYLEVRSLGEFEENVRNHGDRWDDDIRLYKGYSWEDYGKEMFDCCCYQMEEHLQDFFDFEAYGRYMGDCAEEYSDGIIEILR